MEQTATLLTNNQAIEQLSGQEDLVFVSGCFDVLHFGHVYFLREAKKLGKKLLVVIHDDASIRLKKGENRPINPFGYRLELLKELRSIDYLSVWNGWETISKFVTELKPGIIAVTQGSYEKKTVREVAKSIDAKLVPIEFKYNISTSKILQDLDL